MTKSIWYELSEKENGTPVCYFKNKTHAKKFQENYLVFSILEKIPNPTHLENIVKENNKIIASFEFEPHAIKYNTEVLKNKGIIIPN